MADRILVVDDDAHIHEVICFAVEKAGFATALRTLREFVPSTARQRAVAGFSDNLSPAW
jgi:DNA-binding response OmpR family regulator